jgi:hypothetical protein
MGSSKNLRFLPFFFSGKFHANAADFYCTHRPALVYPDGPGASAG